MRRLLPVSLLLVLAASALGQAAPPQAKFTWVRYYTVDRGREADFAQLIRDYTKPMMDRLVAEKKIVAWGWGYPITRTDDAATHIVWMGLPDWGGAEAVGQAIEALGRNASAADAATMVKLGTSIREGSVRDVILRHLSQSEGVPATPPKYVVADTYVIKPGREGDAVALFNEWAKPIFNSVALKPRMPLWGLSSQAIPTEGDWTHMVWYFITDLGALDALDTAMMSGDPRTMQGYEVRLRDMSDVTKQRSQILRLMP